ncbi:hypothetical protein [Xanthomonas fragariae]|uniref:hypothetical protein n=1 Tax=Xanthomonas fragariae TaxID=48664 RepID=UPI000A35C44D|nr:hypothetical protein [Xanthomonas fragariae]SMQ96990.1 hypothetical protein NBC2815_03674 [Xanthomonas fragariae]
MSSVLHDIISDAVHLDAILCMSVVPLYPEETALKLKDGSDACQIASMPRGLETSLRLIASTLPKKKRFGLPQAPLACSIDF